MAYTFNVDSAHRILKYTPGRANSTTASFIGNNTTMLVGYSNSTMLGGYGDSYVAKMNDASDGFRTDQGFKLIEKVELTLGSLSNSVQITCFASKTTSYIGETDDVTVVKNIPAEYVEDSIVEFDFAPKAAEFDGSSNYYVMFWSVSSTGNIVPIKTIAMHIVKILPKITNKFFFFILYNIIFILLHTIISIF